MIHHLSVGTNDTARARTFYDPVMAVVGLRRMDADSESLDYGIGAFLLSIETPVDGNPATPGNGVHIAFTAEDRAMVDRFYRTALDNGGSDAGAPGLRPEYNANYYGAFVRDPDGNKIEAVTYSAV
ncbi:VOC family protein [Sphingomonas gilva]|uniref:VOC family protein n=1 Tax=Sphingomonas gilva TaxID=2305907 RepID=A0A396S5W9_9SPHN|nr:VOC family protein [Sphingomonas gilva]RHW18805.1 VOC family protein [Sphingomonas gilva]